MNDVNGWLYHRIRMCIWKQWKRVRTRYRNLRVMGVPKDLAWKAANSRRGYWFTTHTVAINMAMTKERLINSGFYDLATAYQSVHVNYWKRCIREPYVQCCERTAVSHRLLLDWFYSSYIYPIIPPTKASVFSVLPQEHFLLDILGVPLVGIQSIRRALVGLPLRFPQYCIEGTGRGSSHGIDDVPRMLSNAEASDTSFCVIIIQRD